MLFSQKSEWNCEESLLPCTSRITASTLAICPLPRPKRIYSASLSLSLSSLSSSGHDVEEEASPLHANLSILFSQSCFNRFQLFDFNIYSSGFFGIQFSLHIFFFSLLPLSQQARANPFSFGPKFDFPERKCSFVSKRRKLFLLALEVRRETSLLELRRRCRRCDVVPLLPGLSQRPTGQ